MPGAVADEGTTAADAEPAAGIIDEPTPRFISGHVAEATPTFSEIQEPQHYPDEPVDDDVARTFAPAVGDLAAPDFVDELPPAREPEPPVAAPVSLPVAAEIPAWIAGAPTPVMSGTPVTSAEPIETFATETMAELYVRQGLRYEAIAVYRKLVEARPGDAGLRQRLAELEEQRQVASGPTAGAFFSALATRRKPRMGAPAVAATPSFLLESVPPVDAGTRAGTAGVVQPVDGDAVVTGAAMAGLVAPAAPPRSQTLSDLFSDPAVSPYDDAAARALSEAFGDAPPPTARRATGPASAEKLRSWLDDPKTP